MTYNLAFKLQQTRHDLISPLLKLNKQSSQLTDQSFYNSFILRQIILTTFKFLSLQSNLRNQRKNEWKRLETKQRKTVDYEQ
jgi:hypothetical protein